MMAQFGGFQKAVATGAWVNRRLMVGEDYVERMWRDYSREVRSVPLRRPREGRRFYKAPSYLSFAKYIYALHHLGLIVLTREEPVSTVVTKTGRLASYLSAIPRHYFTIVPGKENDPAWDNPMRWAFVAVKAPPKLPPPKIVAPPIWKPLTLGKTPTKTEISRLVSHLQSLRGLEHEPEVVKELERLSVGIADWVFVLEDRIERLTGARLEEAEELRDALDTASEALVEHDIESAITALE